MNITVPQAWLDDLELEFNIRSNYVGKGMPSRGCFAIIGEHRDLAKFLIFELSSFYETDPRVPIQWISMEMDAMGTENVYYWPWVTVEE